MCQTCWTETLKESFRTSDLDAKRTSCVSWKAWHVSRIKRDHSLPWCDELEMRTSWLGGLLGGQSSLVLLYLIRKLTCSRCKNTFFGVSFMYLYVWIISQTSLLQTKLTKCCFSSKGWNIYYFSNYCLVKFMKYKLHKIHNYCGVRQGWTGQSQYYWFTDIMSLWRQTNI